MSLRIKNFFAWVLGIHEHILSNIYIYIYIRSWQSAELSLTTDYEQETITLQVSIYLDGQNLTRDNTESDSPAYLFYTSVLFFLQWACSTWKKCHNFCFHASAKGASGGEYCQANRGNCVFDSSTIADGPIALVEYFNSYKTTITLQIASQVSPKTRINIGFKAAPRWFK